MVRDVLQTFSMSDNVTLSDDDPYPGEQDQDGSKLLWVPYVCVGLVCIGFFAVNFANYHWKRHKRIQERAGRADIREFLRRCSVSAATAQNMYAAAAAAAVTIPSPPKPKQRMGLYYYKVDVNKVLADYWKTPLRICRSRIATRPISGNEEESSHGTSPSSGSNTSLELCQTVLKTVEENSDGSITDNAAATVQGQNREHATSVVSLDNVDVDAPLSTSDSVAHQPMLPSEDGLVGNDEVDEMASGPRTCDRDGFPFLLGRSHYQSSQGRASSPPRQWMMMAPFHHKR